MKSSGKRFLSLICLSVLITGCSNVTPVLKGAKEPGFDGNDQNAGLIEFSNHSLNITSKDVNEYNALIGLYGDKIGIVRDFGLSKKSDGTFFMTKEAFEDWYRMKLMAERDETERAK